MSSPFPSVRGHSALCVEELREATENEISDQRGWNENPRWMKLNREKNSTTDYRRERSHTPIENYERHSATATNIPVPNPLAPH